MKETILLMLGAYESARGAGVVEIVR